MTAKRITKCINKNMHVFIILYSLISNIFRACWTNSFEVNVSYMEKICCGDGEKTAEKKKTAHFLCQIVNLANKHHYLFYYFFTLFPVSSPISVTLAFIQWHSWSATSTEVATTFTVNLAASFIRELVTYLNNWNFNNAVCLQRKWRKCKGFWNLTVSCRWLRNEANICTCNGLLITKTEMAVARKLPLCMTT